MVVIADLFGSPVIDAFPWNRVKAIAKLFQFQICVVVVVVVLFVCLFFYFICVF